ncbi:MAG: GGDEF domain-containing protein [Campylobacterota bacterium]|nr:GGDEF domain-containing protein [Campylobacterota bacterium]
MKDKMLALIKSAVEDKKNLIYLENIYHLYEQLQYSEDIKEMSQNLYEWLDNSYGIKNLKISLFDIDNNLKVVILKKGEDFHLDDKYSFYFIINTHTTINAIVSFAASNQKQYEKIDNSKDFIEAAFFQISPIFQSAITKKLHIESASIDSVTNVYNRKYLIEHIHKRISLSNNQDENITLMMVGIDRFKAIAEEFDYDIADKVLIELAKVIHGQIKGYDIVSRLTGDEFLIALLNMKEIDFAKEIAQQIIDKFAEVEVVVNQETNQTLKKTVCIGISSYPEDSSDINQVLKNADNFLNEAKNKGRGKIAVFSKEEESTIDLF